MYLRSLELLGFKSFARRAELLFPQGVAAIVGPNGCGKSNVLDAMRWVLGEQSAKALRGTEMADVIFNGNEKAPALGVAEVSLTFSECEAQLGTEWNEVRITRRVYRDGRGEYLLNKTVCRLRDIQELFMDTGIGRTAYSIMEQGKIDQILSSRPEDRRAIFEEAAGITKYKTQRREALRKLEATEANLQRLTDVLAEVKRQVGSLQRQAAKARRYQALHTDLRLLETHLAHQHHCKLEKELVHARAEVERLRAGQEEAERTLAEQEGILADGRAELERLDAELETVRAAASETKGRLQHGESRLEFNGERLAESQARLSRYETELAAAEENLANARSQLQSADAQEREAMARLTDGQQRQRAEDTRLRDLRNRRSAAEASLLSASRRASDADGRLNSARAELARAETEQQAAAARRELLAQEIHPLEPAVEQAAARVVEARQQLARAEQKLAERRAATQAADAAMLAAQKEIAELDARERTAQKAVAERTSRLDVLRQLSADGEGFAAGAKAALKAANRGDIDKTRILGALGAMIEVEPRFIPAIEAVLGQHLQVVLTRDEEAAALILQTLSEKKMGRATLAPSPGSASPLRQTAPAAGAETPLPLSAREAARTTSPEAAALLDRLLAETLIASDLENARDLRNERPGIAVATLAGEFLSRDGLWLGGRNAGEGQSILQRRSQIGALERELTAARQELESLGSQRDKLAATVAQAAADARERREELGAAQTVLFTAQAELGPVEREERAQRARLESFRRELEDFQRRCDVIAERSRRVQAGIDEQAAIFSTASVEKAAAQEALESLRVEEGSLADGVNELRVQVAAEQQRHAGLTREKQPLVSRCRELTDWIANSRRELEEYRRRIAESGEESIRLQTAIASARQELAMAESRVAASIGARAEKIAALDEIDGALRVRRQAASALQEARGAEEVRAAELRLRQENLQDRIARRYQIDLSSLQLDLHAFTAVLRTRETEARAAAQLPDKFASQEDQPGQPEPSDQTPDSINIAPPGTEDSPEPPPVLLPLSAVEALVTKLSERLDSIGAVNLDAIAEYDALEERHQFLEAQNADLRKGEAELRAIIAKINGTSRALFIETFEQVRRNFGEMFRELLGGGRADLVLADESDPLESGIDITARPPGKPLQSITLLSGGEKTMTAVALLFAIYLVKPSPFCVLDEMDAPLDESNINRFLGLLDRFASQSQFIVITHNKRTIARADVLYGVTMEEPGISKLVTVRMSRADEPADAPAPQLDPGEQAAEQPPPMPELELATENEPEPMEQPDQEHQAAELELAASALDDGGADT